MAIEAPNLRLPGCKANADLSAKQFFCVKLAGAFAVDVPSASTDAVVGVLQNKPKSGDAAEVATAGVSKCVAGAAITAGAKVMSDTTGKVIAYVGSAGNTCIGIALEAATQSADVIAVLLKNFGGLQ